MVTTQVTTRSKGKAAKWETQETIRKQATKWIQKVNERNMAKVKEQTKFPEEPLETTDDNSTLASVATMPNYATSQPPITIGSSIYSRP